MPPLCKGRWQNFSFDGGIVGGELYFSVSIIYYFYNPSVGFADSSLYTKEPFATANQQQPFDTTIVYEIINSAVL